jgi:hypothetical protein
MKLQADARRFDSSRQFKSTIIVRGADLQKPTTITASARAKETNCMKLRRQSDARGSFPGEPAGGPG